MAVGTPSIRIRPIDQGQIDDLFRRLQKLPSVIAVASVEAVSILAETAANAAKDHHPYEDRTGNLTRSIRGIKARREGNKIVGRVVAGMHYAPYVELGTQTTRAYPFLYPAVRATLLGAKGLQVLKGSMAATRIAQGLKTNAQVRAEVNTAAFMKEQRRQQRQERKIRRAYGVKYTKGR